MLMLSSFFTNDLFHFKHIMVLIVCALIIVFGTIYSLKYIKVNVFHRILLIVGIVSESLKVFTYIVLNEGTLGGYLPKTDLPFHLCSIQLIFIFLLNVSSNEKLKHLLQSFMVPTCLIGGVLALFIATSSSLNNWIITIQYFVYHSAIATYALYLLLNKEIKFTVKDYLHTIEMLFAIFFIAIYINSILYTKDESGNFININFMYVVNPPMDGLPFLTKEYGWLVYIVHYALLAVFCVTLCYIKPIIDAIKSKINNKNKETICEE